MKMLGFSARRSRCTTQRTQEGYSVQHVHVARNIVRVRLAFRTYRIGFGRENARTTLPSVSASILIRTAARHAPAPPGGIIAHAEAGTHARMTVAPYTFFKRALLLGSKTDVLR